MQVEMSLLCLLAEWKENRIFRAVVNEVAAKYLQRMLRCNTDMKHRYDLRFCENDTVSSVVRCYRPQRKYWQSLWLITWRTHLHLNVSNYPGCRANQSILPLPHQFYQFSRDNMLYFSLFSGTFVARLVPQGENCNLKSYDLTSASVLDKN